MVSWHRPGYLVASASGDSSSTGVYNTNSDIFTNPFLGSIGFLFLLPFGIPAVPPKIVLTPWDGSDSKVHVTDYPVEDSKLPYSTAEIFTSQRLLMIDADSLSLWYKSLLLCWANWTFACPQVSLAWSHGTHGISSRHPLWKPQSLE